MKLIDKDAIKSKIENLINENIADKKDIEDRFSPSLEEYYEGYEDALISIKNILNNIETKEVDLEKEIKCELLFQKMREAGYMWDSDSKQLLSLKAEPNNEKKPAWSEEDENNLTDTCVAIRKFYHGTNGAQELIDWLKSLKERVIWKPSNKQIRALRWVLNNIPYNTHKEEISGLLEQIQNI